MSGEGFYRSRRDTEPCAARVHVVKKIFSLLQTLHVFTVVRPVCKLDAFCGRMIDQLLVELRRGDKGKHARIASCNAVTLCVLWQTEGVPEWLRKFYEHVSSVHQRITETGVEEDYPMVLSDSSTVPGSSQTMRFYVSVPFCFHEGFPFVSDAKELFLKMWKRREFLDQLVSPILGCADTMVTAMCDALYDGEKCVDGRTVKFLWDVLALCGEFGQRKKIEAQLRRVCRLTTFPETAELAVARDHPECNRVCEGCKERFFTLSRCGGCKKVRYCSAECAKSDRKRHMKACRLAEVD